MKKMALIKVFFSGNKISTALISFLIFVSVFVLCWIQGVYDYRLRFVNILDRYIGDGEIYMQYQSWLDQSRIRNIIDETSQMPGVKSVLYNVATYWADETEEVGYTIYYYPYELSSRIDFGTNIKEYTGGDSIECIASYGLAEKGDTLKLHTIADSDFNEKEYFLDFQVMETTEKDFLYLNFTSSGGSEITASSNLLSEVNVLFVTGEAFLEYINEAQQYYDMNCYVIYETDASSEEIENARSIISEHGEYLSISNVVENSKKSELAQIERIIMIPRTVIIVVTLACFSVMLLILQEKMREYSIYFLCGCSKSRIALLSFCSLSLIVIIPCFLNFVIILFHEKISDIFHISFGSVIYSGHQILFTILYLTVVLLAASIIELIMIAGMSPVEMYRRMSR